MILYVKIRAGKAADGDFDYRPKPKERTFLPKEQQMAWLKAAFVPEAWRKEQARKKRG